MRMNLLITTLFSLLIALFMLFAIYQNWFCGLTGHDVLKGVIITIIIAMSVYCLWVLFAEFVWIAGFIAVVGIISAIYFLAKKEPLDLKTHLVEPRLEKSWR